MPTALPFDAWLDYLFGMPVGPSGFRESDDWWDEQSDPEVAVGYLTRLFETPDMLLGRYPHDQLDRGLWFLAGESGHLQPGGHQVFALAVIPKTRVCRGTGQVISPARCLLPPDQDCRNQ